MQNPETKLPSKIILTGGHAATTALAVVEELSKRNRNLDLIWIGPRSAMEGRMIATAAEKVMREAGVRVITIDAGRLKRRGNILLRLLALAKVPLGFIQAFFSVIDIRPAAVISFGGFAAFPVVFAAWLLRIPTLVHEQVVGMGLANRLSLPFATKVTVAREISMSGVPKGKSVLIGNPQIAKMFSVPRKTAPGDFPVIYVTGGSSGAQIINRAVAQALGQLLGQFAVIHQVGENNIEEYQKVKKSLPSEIGKNYTVVGYVSPYAQADLFSQADIIIARAGANTVADIVNCQRPAILIPIPWSIGDEQNKNARAARDLGIARIMEQENLSGESLVGEIKRVAADWKDIVQNARQGEFVDDRQAASKLVDILESLMP